MRRTYKERRNDEGEAQRRRWTFYEAITVALIWIRENEYYGMKSSVV
ncbi:MAG: hypothetical protein NTY64_18045 [Deltaproteobacteria bacterium]|nr:hypothetical protein [Deltaproteobacteria bacterium]